MSNRSIQAAAAAVLERFGRVDILLNGAGGNRPQATTSPDRTFFDLPPDAIRWVIDLNFMGTLLGEWRAAGPAPARRMRIGILVLLFAIVLCALAAKAGS